MSFSIWARFPGETSLNEVGTRWESELAAAHEASSIWNTIRRWRSDDLGHVVIFNVETGEVVCEQGVSLEFDY